MEKRWLPLSKVSKLSLSFHQSGIKAVIFSDVACLGWVAASPLSAFLHLFAGSSALWRGKLALPRTMFVTCLPSTTPSSLRALLSTSSPRWWSARTRVSRAAVATELDAPPPHPPWVEFLARAEARCRGKKENPKSWEVKMLKDQSWRQPGHEAWILTGCYKHNGC